MTSMRCPLCYGPTPQEQVQVCPEHQAMLLRDYAEFQASHPDGEHGADCGCISLEQLDAVAAKTGWW